MVLVRTVMHLENKGFYVSDVNRRKITEALEVGLPLEFNLLGKIYYVNEETGEEVVICRIKMR